MAPRAASISIKAIRAGGRAFGSILAAVDTSRSPGRRRIAAFADLISSDCLLFRIIAMSGPNWSSVAKCEMAATAATRTLVSRAVKAVIIVGSAARSRRRPSIATIAARVSGAAPRALAIHL